MPRYRKKPVIIEAFQMTAEQWDDFKSWPEWFKNATDPSNRMGEGGRSVKFVGSNLVIRTLEGDHQVTVNDWIIQGVKGELYPCKPDIFEMTYDPVEDI